MVISAGGQGFKVLPNVKHVPAHLKRGGTSSPQSSSRSSTPAGLDRGHISDRPYSPANYPRLDDTRDRSSSREGEPETEADVIARFSAMKTTVTSDTDTINTITPSAAKSNNPKQLRLKTGFSRQFSDDLPTPTAITDLVRMIEDIDEKPERLVEEDLSSGASNSPDARTNGRNAALSSLQLNLEAGRADGGQQRLTYAGIVGKPSSNGATLMPDISHIEPQTPRTPSGFVTPGGESVDDPFGILKNLKFDATGVKRASP